MESANNDRTTNTQTRDIIEKLVLDIDPAGDHHQENRYASCTTTKVVKNNVPKKLYYLNISMGLLCTYR